MRPNPLLIEHACAGKIVARVKGGDAHVFGRAVEEIAAVDAAGYAIEIIPASLPRRRAPLTCACP